MDDGDLTANPCARVKLPEKRPRVLEILTPEQVAALAAAITPSYEIAVWLAACAGLRRGEVLGLTMDRIEFIPHRIQVVEQMQNRELCALKSKAVPRRTVPVDYFILAKINQHIEAYPPAGLLITNRLGRPVQGNSFGWCWREAVKAAGLPPGTRFHDLRHFYASALIAANLNPKVIQTRLGHASITETMDTYGHLFPDDADLGRGAIEAMFAGEDFTPVSHSGAGI